jgi:hypothetical protein
VDDSVLVSFAILTTEWEERKRGYVDNFVPFAADCIRRQSNDEISAHALRDCMSETFGIRLPLNSVRVVLDRCKRTGIVTLGAGVFRRVQEKVGAVRLDKSRETALREHAAILDDTSRMQE